MAAMGIPKSDRDYLGRWLPEGADTYAGTYRAVVSRLRLQFAVVLRSGKAFMELDEAAAVPDLANWLLARKGFTDRDAADADNDAAAKKAAKKAKKEKKEKKKKKSTDAMEEQG